MKIKIGKFLISTDVNGPGRRFVIWFQGCPIRCKGCFNPEFWDETGGILMDDSEMIARIDASQKIEGVTFTGGEPLAQAKRLLPFAQSIKSKGLTIVCYTGYSFQDILNGNIPYAKDLLRWIDILIDGPYIEEEKATIPWRGSRNQKVHFLTDRYKHLEPVVAKEGTTEIELQIGKESINISGIFDIKLWERLKKEINR